MSEALIVRKLGGGDSGSGGGSYSDVIAHNSTFTVPKSGNYLVTCIGGGGGGGSTYWYNYSSYYGYIKTSGGGGSGNVNTKTVSLAKNSTITITIGAGGALSSTGGTTAFGSYVSATGGSCGTNAGSGGAGSGGSGFNSGKPGVSDSSKYSTLNEIGGAGGKGGILWYANSDDIINIATSGAAIVGYGHGGSGVGWNYGTKNGGTMGLGGMVSIKYID